MSVSPGTDDSFGVIVPLYAAAMLRLAAAYVGPADAEDAVQEAALRAWQAWPTLRNPAAVRPWLLQITVNVHKAAFGHGSPSPRQLVMEAVSRV